MKFGQNKFEPEAYKQNLRQQRIEQDLRQDQINRFNWMGTIGALVLSVGSLGYVGIKYLP